jgi:hypothetical protein
MSERSVWAREDGNTLILMPVAVLILLLLGATALDGAIVLLADRELNDVASGLANDAASLVDEEAFYRDGTVRISQGRVDALVAQMVPLLQDDPLEFTCASRVAPSGDRVTVTCSGATALVFLPALPAAGTLGDVEASATARAETG